MHMADALLAPGVSRGDNVRGIRNRSRLIGQKIDQR